MSEIQITNEKTELTDNVDTDPDKWESVIHGMQQIIERTEKKLRFFQNRLKQAQFMETPSLRRVRAAEAQVDMHSAQLENLRSELYKLERLQSGGIQLRLTTENELRRIWGWINQPDMRGMLYAEKISFEIFVEDWQRWTADAETHALSIETLTTRLLLGFMLLRCSADVVVVEFVIIRPGYRTRGYGTDALTETMRYAFEELNAVHITLQVSPDNDAALTCFENAGFQYLGYTDVDAPVYTMGVERSEWENDEPDNSTDEQITSQRLHATLQEFLK
ncbi:MAG: GNAT family protein [Candidatus Poribacteria bacterium]|nr:GNAT family protein [Candidatus Poribacteria bacterium]